MRVFLIKDFVEYVIIVFFFNEFAFLKLFVLIFYKFMHFYYNFFLNLLTKIIVVFIFKAFRFFNKFFKLYFVCRKISKTFLKLHFIK